MAASSNPRKTYHVFLSFRGSDVRNSFLAHLYAALDRTGIYAYIDSEELRKGEQISPALMKALEDSRVAIVVFSEDYASSPWCLEEVAQIMECKKQNDMIVLPVFYKVEPREVRGGRKSYARAMAKHESKFGKDSEKVKRWKEALFEAGSLSGWALNDEDEAKLIRRIVKEISMQLDRTPLHVAKHPIGIHPQVLELKSMLNLESDDDVLVIGLWGQGGIGKTTLAKALYNNIFRQFEASCFLANIWETSKDSKDLAPLQEKLLSEILLGKGLTVFSVDGGINLMQERLCRKKILIVLDDVNDRKQLNALAGEREWFGKGSRIIITTRDSHLLTAHGVDKVHIYEVKPLKNGEDLKLFNKHAFLRNNGTVIRRALVDRALHYANGLPLALQVLGSFLCGRREHEWESALNKLAKSPDKTINDVLKLSYDGLEDYAKEIFLDIACFFKGLSTEYIMKVLNCCDFDTTIGVQVLVEKSLITAGKETLQMHDLIQLMGMDIVKHECRDDPNRRSRLWLIDDILDVLLGNMRTEAVKAIVLRLPKPEVINIGPDAFTNMRRLRVLIMINVRNSFQGPIYLPNELRWFEWPECPPWIPEFSSGLKKLAGLDLHKSNIQVLRNQFMGFEKLKFINFSKCQLVVDMPDLDCTPNLEELDLHGCKNLEHAHESIAHHSKLQKLNLSGCSKLSHLSDVLESKNLQLLNLDNCSGLQRFPDILDEIKGLRHLYLRGTSIEELPASVEKLVSLEKIDLNGCKKLATLPSSIYRLQNLEVMMLQGCSKLIKFPKKGEDSSDPHTKTGFPKLKGLYLNGCNLYELQEIQKTPEFVKLLASGCNSLSKIPSDMHCGYIDFSSCHELLCSGFTMDNLFNLEHSRPTSLFRVLPGENMPKWLLPNEDGYISFMASKDLYKKLLGLAFCVVFRVKKDSPGTFDFLASVNGERTWKGRSSVAMSIDLDHVWLEYHETDRLWGRDASGPNDSFQFMIRAWGGAIVKKCGFRLICKRLENDLDVPLQDDQLLDSALLYEVSHEDTPTSTKEESSRATEDLQDSETCRKEEGFNTADISIEKYRYSQIFPEYRNFLPGGEMPREFVLVEDGIISFKASRELYNKFLGLALCVVFNVEDGRKETSFDIVPRVNGQRRNVLSGNLDSFDSDHMWIQYLESNMLWGMLEGGVDFGQESCLQFTLGLTLTGGTVKKLGYLIRCEQLEDDLKEVLEDNQLVDPAALWEYSDGSTNSSECHRSTEELEASETNYMGRVEGCSVGLQLLRKQLSKRSKFGVGYVS
ncbi:TMV resistance protein N-like [Rhodamnia argentea]|uniref:TMV resistance protein N-like n=1 Tax=Rhodamnia argentea TaxID=178133 RepID=A0ABM3H7R7_9MYRT|nr:TMV resistance protein N-like [Rhodamnia argentea]